MGSALRNRCADNWGAANRAGLSLALINLEVILEIASAVDPVNAGTVVGYAKVEAFPDFFKQQAGLAWIYAAAAAFRVDFAAEESFI